MISAPAFLSAARQQGVDFLTGVPCSFLTPFINCAISDPSLRYVGAASEGEAVGIAAGAWLAGGLPIVMCQNSGLGNMVNPLTSLNFPFRIPTLLIVTWRGQPGLKDEPQHELMGEITHALLGVMRIPHRPFPKTDAEISPALDAAMDAILHRDTCFALVMEQGAVAPYELDQVRAGAGAAVRVEDRTNGGRQLPSRVDLLRFVHQRSWGAGAAVVATTGKTGRELFTVADTENQIYQVGSMGCAASMALGVALNSKRRVIVLDGDGAALMKLGTLATVGAEAPEGLIHIVLDNGVHDSTGGQATVSATTQFAHVAAACGYRFAGVADDLAGFMSLLDAAFVTPGPAMIHAKIAPGSIKELGRPTIPPDAVARRFRRFLAEG